MLDQRVQKFLVFYETRFKVLFTGSESKLREFNSNTNILFLLTTTHSIFYVLLTVHLSIILVINQLNAQIRLL